jgi:hypothetical protein
VHTLKEAISSSFLLTKITENIRIQKQNVFGHNIQHFNKEVQYERWSFEQQRPAIAMSTAIGLALSFGLAWWEQANDFSIKDLGPIAVGFAILLLAFVMYQCIRHVGGSWAGAGITIGASIIIAQLLGMHVPIDHQIIQTVIVVALIFGLLALMSHRHHLYPQGRFKEPGLPDIKHTMADLYRERHLSKKFDHGLRTLRKEAQNLHEHPEEAADIATQIKRMLPAQGYLTESMARLRTKAHRIQKVHIARLEETRHVFSKLPASAKKEASAGLTAAYNQMGWHRHSLGTARQSSR